MSFQKVMQLKLRTAMPYEEKCMAIEWFRLNGFWSEHAVFPVTSMEEGSEVPSTWEALGQAAEELQKSRRNLVRETEAPSDYEAASAHAKPVPDFDWRNKKGLETVLSKGQFLKDHNLDLLPDAMDVTMVLPKDSDDFVLEAACNLAFRLGMETTAYEGRFAAAEEPDGNAIVFEGGSACGMRLEEKEAGYRLVISGEGKALVQFVSHICEKFPLVSSFDTWADRLQEMTDSFAMKNMDGQMAYTKAFAKDGAIVYADPKAEQQAKILKEQFPQAEFQNYKGMKKIYEKEYDITWEVDDCLELFRERILPELKPEDQVTVLAALSEEADVRATVKEQLEQMLQEAGVTVCDKDVTVLCAYKQGYSWIEEVLLPQLRGNQVQTVEIAFRPFLPEGVTDWADEDGATPSYNNLGGDPDKWYDLPIRYLQELYPAEDMIAEALDIPREQILFHVYEGDENFTYEVTAKDEAGKVVLRETYQAECSERTYLDDYPHMGKVHPSTGYLKVYVNGNERCSERIRTDVEKVWDIYQEQVLSDCRAFIEEKCGKAPTCSVQPFFSRLQLDVHVSEPDYRLPSREDLFSTLDGLHEDMYFASADYFKNYGMEKAGEMFDAPGLILPVIKKKSGKPYFKVTLFDQLATQPQIQNPDGSITATAGRHDISVWMCAYEQLANGYAVTLQVEGADEAVVRAYASLLEAGVLEFGGQLPGVNKVILKTGSDCYEAKVQTACTEKKTLSIEEIDLMEDVLIGYDQYMAIIEKLKQVPQLAVYRTAVSYTGREIYAVEILPYQGGYTSRTKRISNHPSEMINARHHANEVSATNAAFMLIKTLLTDEAYKGIPNQVNLVIVPMENVDGAAIHYELQKDNPNWKLHVARFSAIGKEFYYEHFNMDSIHTEAAGLRRIFGTFLPDIIVDNHGVPSHEWEQQFSGYTSPSYKGFWLPRSLLYGYFWTVEGEEYRINYAVNKKLEDVIADAIAEDAGMTAWNKEWSARFEKYAHSWMPKLFPANYYKDMINYWIPFAYDANHRYPSIRFPWITTVAYTSEVADETAQGDYLYECAKAHEAHDLAVLKAIAEAKCVYEKRLSITEEDIVCAHTRQRPMILN